MQPRTRGGREGPLAVDGVEDEAALVAREGFGVFGPEFGQVGGHAHHLAAALKKIAHRPQIVSGDDRGGGLHVGALRNDVAIVLVGEIVLAHAGEAAFHRGCAAAPDKHDVLAQRIELLFVPRAESFAQSHQQKQRSHSPCDAKHGKKRPQLVGPQCAQGLPENLKENAHADLLMIRHEAPIYL